MLWAAAGGVDVLDPQQESPVRGPSGLMGDQRRIGVAAMQPPGGGRREAGDKRRDRTLSERPPDAP